MFALWSGFLGQENHTLDTISTIKQNLATGAAVMVDTRGQDERDAGYLKGSIFLSIIELQSLPSSTSEIDGLDKTKIIYTHCKAGVRAAMAAKILQNMGYADVRSIGDSFEALVEQGFEPEG